MGGKSDLTLALLREIRDEIRATNERLGATNEHLGTTNERLASVEATVLDLSQQQRFVVRDLRALTQRDRKLERDFADLRERLEGEIAALRSRMTAIEERGGASE